MDGQHRLREPGPSPLHPLLRTSMVSARAKLRTVTECDPRRACGGRSEPVDGLVHALVTQPHRRAITEPLVQMPAYLLRRLAA